MSKRCGLRLTLAMALVAVMLVPAAAGANAGARATMGGDRLISGAGAVADEWLPAVAYNATSKLFLVVREDERNFGKGSDIYGRLVDSDGRPQGPDIRITGNPALSDERQPDVAWNQTNNQFLVVWTDYRDEEKWGTEIFGRLLKGDGTPLGSDFRISSGVAKQAYPAVAWNKRKNEYLVVWEDYRDSGFHGADIFGRRLKADGTLIGPADTRISKHEPGVDQGSWEYQPDVAWNPASGHYLVVWADIEAGSGRGWDIYGRVMRGDGTFLAGEFRICGAAATSDEQLPAVAANAKESRFLVVWMDWRRAEERGADIYAQQVKAAGGRIDKEVRLSAASATADEAVPAVAWNATGNRYLVVWDDGRNSGAGRGTDTYGQYVDRVGVKTEGNFRISGREAVKDEWGPAVDWGKAKNSFLVVRGDDRNHASSGTDIFGRVVGG